MNTIQGTLRSFRVDNTEHGIRLSFTLKGDATVHQGTFLTEDNKALHILSRTGPGDEVEIITVDEGAQNEVTWKNLSCPMNLTLKQPKAGEFDGVMYNDPLEAMVMSKKVHVRYN